jgi:3-oxoacyl-[acyl-carrier protein] reductase
VKRLVVTGAASGIGAATVRQALDLGYAVAALDVDPERLRHTWRDTAVLPLACDVVDPGAVSSAFAQAQHRWGAPPSALVHAAGVYRVAPATDLTAEQWRGVLDVNATGSLLVCQVFGRRALAAGVRGSAVLLTSIAYERGDLSEPAAHYAASKGAVVSLTRQLAVEWGKAGIRVNAVAPGVISTPMLTIGDHPDVLDAYLRDRVPLGTLGRADDVASACLFLVSDEAAYISGAVLPVDGGAGAA